MVSGTRVPVEEATDAVSGLGGRLRRMGGPGLGPKEEKEAMETLSRPRANVSAMPPSPKVTGSSPAGSECAASVSASSDSDELLKER